MGMDPQQIANVYTYFAKKNADRYNTALASSKRPRNAGGITPQPPPRLRRTWTKTFGIKGNLPTFGNPVAQQALTNIDNVFEPMDESQAPKNATQWLLNLLSTGNYVSARVANEAGHDIEAAGRGTMDPVSAGFDASISPIAAAARGVAEGFGARFDGERPKTYQQNFEQIGLNDNIRKLTPDGKAPSVSPTTTSRSASPGLPATSRSTPLTYVSGAGLIKLAKVGASETGTAFSGCTKCSRSCR